MGHKVNPVLRRIASVLDSNLARYSSDIKRDKFKEVEGASKRSNRQQLSVTFYLRRKQRCLKMTRFKSQDYVKFRTREPSSGCPELGRSPDGLAQPNLRKGFEKWSSDWNLQGRAQVELIAWDERIGVNLEFVNPFPWIHRSNLNPAAWPTNCKGFVTSEIIKDSVWIWNSLWPSQPRAWALKQLIC